ncbi:MAG: MFS transporter [Chitinophagaceae bacterium]|nr:MAG: MFS transporter [Chitinophagaceae bacterium]
MTASFILLAVLPKVTAEQKNEAAATDLLAGLTSVSSPLKDKDFLFFLGSLILFASCFFQLFTTVPVYFKENLRLDEFWIGVVMAANGVLIALFEMVIVFKLEGRKPYLYLMAVGTVLMGASFLLLNLPLASGFAVAMLAVLMLTVAEMVSMPFMNSYYISRSNVANRGQYAGMYTMAWSAAQVIGSSSGSAIAQKIGYNFLWVIAAAICFVSAGAFYWLLHRKPAVR